MIRDILKSILNRKITIALDAGDAGDVAICEVTRRRTLKGITYTIGGNIDLLKILQQLEN